MHSLPLLLQLLAFFSPLVVEAAPPHPRQLRAEQQKRPEIRVLLGAFKNASLSGTDLRLNGLTTLHGASHFSVRCSRDQKGVGWVEFAAGRKTAGPLEVVAPGGFLQVNGRLYRNKVKVLSRGGNCQVVNTVDLEKYLAGLINKEMSPSWPLEAMKAQAVASRSYALYQARANRQKEFDLENTTQDQVYEGASSETAKSNRAAEETRGLVISFGGSALKAYFHANCGGMTELPVAVWGGESRAFRPVICPYHKEPRNKMRWSLRLSREQIGSALRKISGILPSSVFRVARLEAGAPSSQHRLNDVVISDAGGNNLVLSANTFRNAIGNTRLRSTAFRIAEEGDGYKISGEGFGHGVGMCQVGARAMAEEGKNYKQILQYYYPLAKLQRL